MPTGQPEPHDLDDGALRDRAVAAARGRAPFDVPAHRRRGGRTSRPAPCAPPISAWWAR